MSRYFTRLAQRSGLTAPAVVNADANNDAAGIVVQDTYVDTVPTVLTKSLAETGSSTSGVSSELPTATTVGATPPAHKTPPSKVSAPLAARVPVTSPSVSPTSVATTIHNHPTKILERQTTIETHSSEVAAASSMVQASHEAAPVRAAAAVRAGESPRASQAAASPRVQRRMASSSLAVQPRAPAPAVEAAAASSIVETIVGSPSSAPTSEVKTRHVAKPLPATRHEPAGAETSVPRAPVSRATPPAASAAPNVEVRIGAVRVDVHAPAPLSAPVEAPAPAPARAPRFSPRRYHLRG